MSRIGFADRSFTKPSAAAYWRWPSFLILAFLWSASALAAEPVAQNDMLNAELWMRTAVEYRANGLTVYALAKTRLDEALADKNWTAFDQTAGYQAGRKKSMR